MANGDFMNTSGYSAGHKPVNPKPDTTATVNNKKNNFVKVATKELFNLGDPPNNPNTLVDLYLEDMGGQDIINITRTDTVNGISIANNKIVNLTNINDKHNSLNIIPLNNPESEYFASFQLDLLSYIPDPAFDLTTYLTNTGTTYYVDILGNITFYFINLNNEEVEVQFLNIDANLGETKFTV